MVERFADKQIEVLEKICNDNFKSNSVSDYGIEISEKGFIQMIERFQMFGWLKISHTVPLDLSGEEPGCDGKTLIYYEIINKKGLSEFLLKLKKEYPKHQTPLIQEKSIELIARDIGEFDTGVELVKFLQKCGVEKELIIYPNTKWRMIYDVLVYLSYSARNKDRDLFYSIITDSIHPLMHNGDWDKSKQICEKFNQYLVYDRLEIHYSNKDRKYTISYEPTEEEEDKINEEMYEEWSSGIKEMLEFLKKPESKERITIIRKAYQVLINIAETFCLNPSKPTAELNDAYIKIKELIRRNALELKLIGEIECSEYYIHNLYFPFTNLFSAEAEYKNRNAKRIDWDEIRPELNRTFGAIDDIFRDVNGSDILSEPDIQKTLNDVSMLVSEEKKKNEPLKKTYKTQGNTKKILDALDGALIRGFENMFVSPSKDPTKREVQKIEITALPEVMIRNADDNSVVKGKKRIHLPQFKSTPWKDAEIRFLDERNVHIRGGNKTAIADYEGLGFSNDKSKRPNLAWNFLLQMAKNNGETLQIPSPVPDNIKQIKRQISDFLKKLFKNETEPFHDISETRIYKLKIALIPPQTDDEKNKDELGIDDYLNETMVSKYEQPKNDDER